MVGDTIYVMFTEVYDDGSTVRESVQTFEKEETAKNELKLFAAEQDEWIKNNHPNWIREQGSETFYEAYEKDAYYASHAIAKVVKTVVM
jgi:hypothetical protein